MGVLQVWDSVRAAHPDAKMLEIGKIVGQMWKELSDADKQEYIRDYENAKVRFVYDFAAVLLLLLFLF